VVPQMSKRKGKNKEKKEGATPDMAGKKLNALRRKLDLTSWSTRQVSTGGGKKATMRIQGEEGGIAIYLLGGVGE